MANDNSEYTFEDIADMLKSYKDLMRLSLQLEFEINDFVPIATGDDIIDAMTFSKPEGDGVNFLHRGNSSDKTSKIAVSYAEKTEELNKAHKQELEAMLRSTRAKILRIEYYISILDRKHSAVLRKLYLEEKTFIDAAKELNIAVTTLKNCRKAGIMKLAEMFNLVKA